MWSCCARSCAKCKASSGRTASDVSRRIHYACSIRRFQTSRHHREVAADLRSSLRRLPRAFCEAERRAEAARDPIEENWRLVRGLDYYTRTTFEVTAEGLGSQMRCAAADATTAWWSFLAGSPRRASALLSAPTGQFCRCKRARAGRKVAGLAVFVAWMSAKAYPTAVDLLGRCAHAGLPLSFARGDEIQEIAWTGG